MALILVADGDADVANNIVLPLSKLEHRVVAASTIRLAMDWLGRTNQLPDLVIADVGVKTFQGQEFIEDLKKSSRLKSIPIIVQTKSLEMDIFPFSDGTLQKPYSSRELVHVVNMVLRNIYFSPNSKVG
jgi:DNA-binding response OmpR family regulator